MKWLVSGAAGFIGSNTAKKLLSSGHEVVILDIKKPDDPDLSPRRPWPVNICDYASVHDIVQQNYKDTDVYLHCCGQTAVTTSLVNPKYDFMVNALGTVNLLEAIRINKLANPSVKNPIFIYMSTNKIYGDLACINYRVQDESSLRIKNCRSICETEEASPVTPYGISKYTGELYCDEYAASYGLNTFVLRCSCIYGPNQNSSFNQGWISHMVQSAINGQEIQVCGDGKQVRDCLHVDDLINLYLKIAEDKSDWIQDTSHGSKFFNVGGAFDNTISILELLDFLEKSGHKPKVSFIEPRVGDQRYYCTDISKVSRSFNWRPKVSVWDGIASMIQEKLAQNP